MHEGWISKLIIEDNVCLLKVFGAVGLIFHSTCKGSDCLGVLPLSCSSPLMLNMVGSWWMQLCIHLLLKAPKIHFKYILLKEYSTMINIQN